MLHFLELRLRCCGEDVDDEDGDLPRRLTSLLRWCLKRGIPFGLERSGGGCCGDDPGDDGDGGDHGD
jgi:hypothetical protein